MSRFIMVFLARRLLAWSGMTLAWLAPACSHRQGEVVVAAPNLTGTVKATDSAVAALVREELDASESGRIWPDEAADVAGAPANVDEPAPVSADAEVTELPVDAVAAPEASFSADAIPAGSELPDAAADGVATLLAGDDAQDALAVVADPQPVDVQVAAPADLWAGPELATVDVAAPVDVAAAPDLKVSNDAKMPSLDAGPEVSSVAAVDAGPSNTDPPGWKLTWADEFNGKDGSPVDPTRWSYDVGCGPDGDGWGNGELQWYTSGTANAVVGGGALVVTAKVVSPGTQSCVAPGAVGYTSARLHTQGKFAQKYGRFEARMQIPAGIGLWAAFWMMGADYVPDDWPICGEIDVMENAGNEAASVHGAIHGPTTDSSPTGETYVDEGLHGMATLAQGKLADAFHVYAIEWEVGVVRWYLDGKLYFAAKPSDLPAGATWVFDHPFFLVLNLAVGGAFPDPPKPDATTVFPKKLVVDWVRVYQKL